MIRYINKYLLKKLYRSINNKNRKSLRVTSLKTASFLNLINS